MPMRPDAKSVHARGLKLARAEGDISLNLVSLVVAIGTLSLVAALLWLGAAL